MKKIVFLFTLLSSIIAGYSYSQSISGASYTKAKIAQKWIQEQTEKGVEITRERMDSLNAALSAMKFDDTDTAKVQYTFFTIIKTGVPGSTITVPQGKCWKIKSMQATIDGNGVEIKSVKFAPFLREGEQFSFPLMTEEAKMFTDNAMSTTYSLEIEESDIQFCPSTKK